MATIEMEVGRCKRRVGDMSGAFEQRRAVRGRRRRLSPTDERRRLKGRKSDSHVPSVGSKVTATLCDVAGLFASPTAALADGTGGWGLGEMRPMSVRGATGFAV